MTFERQNYRLSQPCIEGSRMLWDFRHEMHPNIKIHTFCNKKSDINNDIIINITKSVIKSQIHYNGIISLKYSIMKWLSVFLWLSY